MNYLLKNRVISEINQKLSMMTTNEKDLVDVKGMFQELYNSYLQESEDDSSVEDISVGDIISPNQW